MDGNLFPIILSYLTFLAKNSKGYIMTTLIYQKNSSCKFELFL